MSLTFDKIINGVKTRKFQYIFSFCILLYLFGHGYFYAQKGISFREEGLWLSSSLRYVLGDYPFRDEILNTIRLSDILFSPVSRIFPAISVLQVRCIGLIIQLTALIAIFFLLSRYAPPAFVAFMGGVAFFLHDTDGRFQFHNTFSGTFSVLSLVFWLYASLSDRKNVRISYSILGGLCFALNVFCYNPKLLTLCVPLLAIALSIFSLQHRRIFLQPSVIFIGIFGIFFTFVLLAIIISGLWPDYIDALGLFINRMTTAQTINSAAHIERSFFKIFSQFMMYPIHLFQNFLLQTSLSEIFGIKEILIFIVVCSILLFSIRKFFRYKYLPWIVVIFCCSYILVPLSAKHKILSFSFLLALLSIFLPAEKNSLGLSETPPWQTIRNYALFWGLIEAITYTLSSGPSPAAKSILILFVFGLVSVYRFFNDIFSRDKETRLWEKRICTVLIVIFTIPFLLAGLNYNEYKYLYRVADAKVEKLTTRFDHPKLKSISSTAEKVAVTEEILLYLDGKVKPHDYFLVYPVAPLLYFLTDTRPAYRTMWSDFKWAPSIHERLVKGMIERERVPEYCVRLQAKLVHDWNRPIWKENYPLDTFVRSNYHLEKTIAPFEIWRRND